MGKKSLLASTKKKKAANKRKKAKKKSVKASAAQKTAKKPTVKKTTKVEATVAAQKKTAAKAPVAAKKQAATNVKKTTTAKAKTKTIAKVTKITKAKTKANTKAKTTAKAKPNLTVQKKAPVAQKKKVTLKDLVLKEFAIGKAAKSIKIKKRAVKLPEAPPFVAGNKKEAARLKGLLLQQFDLKAAKPAKKAPAAQKKTAKKVAFKDLLFKQFDKGTAGAPVSYKKTVVKMSEAPPFVSGLDEKDTEKIRALLFKVFDQQAQPATKISEKAAPTPVSSPEVSPYEPAPSVTAGGAEQMGKAMRLGLCALAFLIAIIIGTSVSNRSNFYLKDTDGGLEVWRGKFAPSGTELVYTLDGVKAPNPLRESYTQKEINPILFGFFLDKADTILNVPAGPDIAKMKAHLRQAVAHAPSTELQTQIQRRLKGVDFIISFHKADVALSKGTLRDLRDAKVLLSSAYSSAITDSQKELVAKTQMAVDEAMAALKTK